MPHLQTYQGPASRHRCPQCNKPRTFTLYVDDNNQSIHPTVGKCDRLVNCGYHLTPKQFGLNNNLPFTAATYKQHRGATYTPPLPPSFIPDDLVQRSMATPHFNNLVMFLADTIGATHAEAVVSRYRTGSSKHWPNATVFWQTDIQGRTRTGKIMLYDRHTGHRIKQPYNHITWAHALLQLPAYNLQQCLFGEHLLAGNSYPVAVVESEKTALIASLYYPQFIWLATGGLSNLTLQTCRPLKDRRVMLMPDLNAYTAWQQKAATLTKIITKLQVSDFLQRHAPTEHQPLGYDLADYLLKEDLGEW